MFVRKVWPLLGCLVFSFFSSSFHHFFSSRSISYYSLSCSSHFFYNGRSFSYHFLGYGYRFFYCLGSNFSSNRIIMIISVNVNNINSTVL